MRRGRKKGSTAQQQSSSCLSQGKTRVLRGQRAGALDDGESSPAESDSSDQGETVVLLGQVQRGRCFNIFFTARCSMAMNEKKKARGTANVSSSPS